MKSLPLKSRHFPVRRSRRGGQNKKYIHLNFTSHILRHLFFRYTFSCAKLAHVCPAVILVHRVEQQPAFSSIKVHLTVEQCRLDQLTICKPVHVGVLRPDDMTLKHNCLSSLGCDVPDRAYDRQTWLNWWRWV